MRIERGETPKTHHQNTASHTLTHQVNTQANIMGYTLETVRKISAELEKLPALEKFSKQSAICFLMDEITKLQSEKNYTLEQIADTLCKRGIEISATTLSTYLSRARASKRNRVRAKKKTPLETRVETALETSRTQTEHQAESGLKNAQATRQERKQHASSFYIAPDSEDL
ncbi:hypothetical protein [Chromobacterium aquaticum]|uniref:Uncharacterized protein n=1 Tax=Chromobacterium aquaticum TaxID=467180 RepID=A0ABV8ZZN2_9NEIS|nr:hypothetical protein [Chromobacterium aquaticum]MCD5363543.1 hypothetical protein [Chromobacterium aquaticum]